jgi:RHH-type rel operon transcriptional repressor/antitoxin RelB
MAPLSAPISVRLPEDLRERIAVIARNTRRSQGDVVREVLERDLADLEWELRIAERAADLRSGRRRALTATEVDAELGPAGDPTQADLDAIS